MKRRLAVYPRDPVAFIDDLIKQNKSGQERYLTMH